MRLLLCVDRDNDFGEKAGVETPVIGRQKNFKAAQKLIMTDPTDSDANTLFAAVKEYDILKSEGEEVSIALISGSSNIGRESDEKIKNELESVLKKLKPKSVILFDDGAEDEAIAPVIESRVVIDRKVRVIVQQSERIESFYYMIKRFLMEERGRKKVLIPLALSCIVWALAAFAGKPEIGAGAIVFMVGITFLIWAYNLENAVINMTRDAKAAVMSGAISVYIYLFAVVVLLLGMVIGFTESLDAEGLEQYLLVFLKSTIWFILGAIWLIVFGKWLDMLLRFDRKELSIWPVSFALVAIGLLLTGAIGLIEMIRGYESPSLYDISIRIVLAAIVAFVGIVGHGYIKEHLITPAQVDDWRF